MPSARAVRPPPAPRPRRRLLPRWRFYTWIILAFNAFMLASVVSGADSGNGCSGMTGAELAHCDAGALGAELGVTLLVGLWGVGEIILLSVWVITRPQRKR